MLLCRFWNLNLIPMCKPSWPSKDGGYAVCASFTTFLMNSVVSGDCSMGCFGFNCLPIRAYLDPIHTPVSPHGQERRVGEINFPYYCSSNSNLLFLYNSLLVMIYILNLHPLISYTILHIIFLHSCHQNASFP